MTTTLDLPTVVSANELAAHKQSVVLIDVRTPGEFVTAHIPGSHNIPLDQLAGHANRLTASVQEPVVLICGSGIRARQAEQTLRSADMSRIHLLDGGLASWTAAQLPTNRGQERAVWNMERQVRGVAGGIVLTGALGGLLLWRPIGAIAAGIGGGLLFSAISDTCTMARLLSKLPYNTRSTTTADVESVITGLELRGISAATAA